MVDYTNIGFDNLIYPYPAGTDNTGNAFNPSQLDPGTVGFRLSLDVSELDGTFAVQTSGNTQDLFEVSNEGGYVTADGDDIFQWGSDSFKGIAMGPGNDTVTGSGIAEIMAYGGTGDDSIVGGSQADTIQGDGYDSADLANPNSLFVPTDPVTVDGNDTLFGVGGNDTIMGDGGNDQVYGGTGSDTVSGGAGNDFLSGGPRGDGDTDLVTGGTGADAFLLSYNADGAGDSDFWNDFAGHLLETVGGEAVGEAVSSFIENGVEEITESAVGVAGFAGGAGFLAEGFISLLADLLATKEPRNMEDVLVIPDFDPSEDVLILPIEENVALTGMVMNFTQTAVGGFSGWGIEFSADNAPYAQVLLSSTYLESMGVTEENGMSQLNRLLSQQVRLNQNATIDGVNFPDGVLKSTNLTDFGGTYTPPAGAQLPGGTKATLFGAYGPLLSVTATSTNVAPVGGTIYGDVISLNDKIIDPENFQASDSNDIGGYARGFAGGDLIYGTRNNDTIFGDEGNDTIYTFDSSPTGPNGADVVKETIDAGDGDDIVYTGGSAGPFDGGTGSDTLAFFYGTLIDPLKVEVDFTAATPYAYERAPSDNSPPGTNINTLGNYYAVTNFETVIGGPLDDWMKGDSSGLTLEGGAGADTIDGGGASLAGFSTSPAGVTVNMFTGVYSGGDAAGDTITNVAGLVGSNFDDVLTDNGVSILTGLGGADTFAYEYTPTPLFNAEITDFSAADGDKVDLRPQGVTAFDQISFLGGGGAIFVSESPNSGNTLQIKMNTGGVTAENFIFADAVSGQVRGTAVDDAFVGAAADDELIGKGGNDHLFGGGGDDTLMGGDGVDVLDGQDGDDYGRGGRDRDSVRGGEGDDTLMGGEGDDTVTGDEGDDELAGGDGDDLLDGGEGDDELDGGDGDDTLTGGDGDDTVTGGIGDDLVAGDGADAGLRIRFLGESAAYQSIYGWYDTESHQAKILVANVDLGTNPDVADFEAHLPVDPDKLDQIGFFLVPNGYALNGQPNGPLAGGDPAALDLKVFEDGGEWKIKDTASGSMLEGSGAAAYFSDPAKNPGGKDHIMNAGDLGAGHVDQSWEDLPNLGDQDFDDAVFNIELVFDEAEGGQGDDELFGGLGDDTLVGGPGDDALSGDRNNDLLLGGTGDDNLDGGREDDILKGGGGNDDLTGGRGEDTLDGGEGDDDLTGGRDADLFVAEWMTGVDLITDFEIGVDAIDVSDFGFAGFDDLLAGATHDGADLLIELSGLTGDALILEGIARDGLQEGDFILS